jgi:hypothetical protein
LKKQINKKKGKVGKKRKVILDKKRKKGKFEKKMKKKVKKKKECIVDYYCNPQCIGCG